MVRLLLLVATVQLAGASTLSEILLKKIAARSVDDTNLLQLGSESFSSGCDKNCGEKCHNKGNCKDKSCKNDSKNCDRLPGCKWKKGGGKCFGTAHSHNPHTHDPHTHDPHTHDPHTHDPHSHAPHSHSSPTAAPALAEGLSLSTYWDCNGQSIDAAAVTPFSTETYISPAGYTPQDPNDHGGAEYGETMWILGAASPNLKTAMGDVYGGCLLIQNKNYAVESSWTIVAMVTSDCPDDTNSLCSGTMHLDLAVPGYDAAAASASNVCGDTSYSTKLATTSPTNGISKADSEIMDGWYVGTSEYEDGGPCDYKNGNCSTKQVNDDGNVCDGMTTGPDFVAGCNRFSDWGWTTGTPGQAWDTSTSTFAWTGDVEYAIVTCPAAFTAWVDDQYSSTGPADNDYTSQLTR